MHKKLYLPFFVNPTTSINNHQLKKNLQKQKNKNIFEFYCFHFISQKKGITNCLDILNSVNMFYTFKFNSNTK